MNQIKSPSTEDSAPVAPAARSAPLRLPPTDPRALLAPLMQGEDALARRKDLGELHKRLVAMLTTLTQGLGEAQATKAAEDRSHLVARLDEVERALNSMEGALRIELEPMLRAVVNEAVIRRVVPQRNWLVRIGLPAVVFAAGLALGVTFTNEISGFLVPYFGHVDADITSDSSFLPPDGGIETGTNQVE